MANENLKAALTRSGLTPEEFADIVQVDEKTVKRWLAGRTPYPRHRQTVARALDTTEHTLWPDTVPEPTAPSHPSTSQLTPATEPSPLGDIVGSWGRYMGPGPPNLIELIAAATRRIDVRHLGRRFSIADPLISLIADRARAGCQIRIISQDPTPDLATLIGVERIEVRVATTPSDTCLIRCDDDILLLLPIGTSSDPTPASIHLHRQVGGGLFDRYLEYLDFECASTRTTDAITDPEQFATHLVSERANPTNGPAPTQPAPRPARSYDEPTPQADPATGRDGRRHWPRRPT